MPPRPEHPIYVPSWSRADHATTPRVLDNLGLDYQLVVEADQLAAYRRHYPPGRLLVLDPAYQRDYEALGDFAGQQLGPGPVRNFCWDHAKAAGAPWFWTMDDNITAFFRLTANQRVAVTDGAMFAAMEDFSARYTNVAMAGPQYAMFAPSRAKMPPFLVNGRIFSCQLHRTDVPLRYRGRYNDDAILSLDLLKAGWCTVLFYAFLQRKAPTQTVPGGCHEAFYAVEGTLPKSQMLVRAHPDVARIVWRYGRWHHQVDWQRFTHPLVRDPAWQPPAVNPYRFRRVKLDRSALVLPTTPWGTPAPQPVEEVGG
jgi:TET-Associated Glycosyltransferase